MKIENTPLKDCFIIHDTVHGDARGYFIETFNQKDFAAATGLDIVFVQDNQSRSSKGVLRGLHMQKGDAAQAKLVRVIEGAVLDIAVDLRKESPDYGKSEIFMLNPNNQLYVPRYFAHGFLTLEDDCIVQYLVDNVYNKESEKTLFWNEVVELSEILKNIELIISEKDNPNL